MRNRTLLVSGLLLGTTVLSGCGSQSLSSTTSTGVEGAVDLSSASFDDQTGRAAIQVDAIDNSFEPGYVEVSVGTAVTFRNDGRNEHNVVPVQGKAFASIPTADFQPGSEKAITFTKPGDYPYYCTLHGTKTKGMIGAIRVS